LSEHASNGRFAIFLYEESLLRFQQRLGQQQPPGFGGSASFRVAALPWLGNRPGYEDWCLLDGSWALDPLNAFAVAGPVMSAHDSAAAQMEEGHGGLNGLVWGEPFLSERSTAVWLTRPRGIEWRPVLEAMRQQLPQTTLWRRQMVLGPGKEVPVDLPTMTGCQTNSPSKQFAQDHRPNDYQPEADRGALGTASPRAANQPTLP
jgi:hypothetical protein